MIDKLNKPKYKDIPDKINEIIDNLGTSTGANIDLSNLSSTGESKFQEPLVSGTNIKTVNGTSILGGGNINTSEIFIAEYGVTPIGILIGEFNSSKCVILKVSEGSEVTDDSYISLKRVTISGIVYGFEFEKTINGITYQYSSSGNPVQMERVSWNSSIVYSSSNNDLSNLSSIGEAHFQTPLGYTPVNKAGDTMTDDLIIEKANGNYFIDNPSYNYTQTSAPSSDISLGHFYFRDTNNNNCGGMTITHNTSNNVVNTLFARRSISGTEKSAYIQAWVDSSGDGHCNLPQSNMIDGQWVQVGQEICSNQALNSSDTDLPKTVTLPNDGHNYEIAIRASCTTGNTSGNYIQVYVHGNVIGAQNYMICSARTRANSTVIGQGTVILPMKYGSGNLSIVRRTSFTGTCDITAIAYRRIGTNS